MSDQVRHAVGDRVIRRHSNGTICWREEMGIVVAVWDGHHDGAQDCYVALYGASWPEEGQMPEEMYVGRYMATSLTPAPKDEAGR